MSTATANATPRTIHELRKYDGPLYIANNTLNLITLHEQIGDGRVDFELAPKGEPDSVMMMPKLALEVRGIQKLWISGDITVSTDDSMEEKITLLLNQSIRAPQERLDAIMSHSSEGESVQLAESASNKALSEQACLECGHTDPTTGVVTRGRVIQSVRDINEGVPPLCPVHAGQSTQWTPRPVLDDEGNRKWEFDKVTLTSPVREQ